MDRNEQQRVRAERQKAYFEADFQPNTDGPPEYRKEAALNYMAYHLGQISKSLAILAAAQKPG